MLSIETWRIQEADLQTPWKQTDNQCSTRASTRRNRNIIHFTKEEHRQRMYTYSHGGIALAEFPSLLNYIETLSEPLTELIRISSNLDQETAHPHRALTPFFRSCCKLIFPAIHFIPKSLWHLIKHMIEEQTVTQNEVQIIASTAPVLSQFLAYYYTAPSENGKQTVSLNS